MFGLYLQFCFALDDFDSFGFLVCICRCCALDDFIMVYSVLAVASKLLGSLLSDEVRFSVNCDLVWTGLNLISLESTTL